jgi:voltage-gated potassium channel
MRFFWKKRRIESNLEIEGNDFFFLLLSLLALLFLWPLLVRLNFGEYLFTAVLFAIFSSSIYAVGKKNLLALIIIALFFVAIMTLRLLDHHYRYLLMSLAASILTVLCFFSMSIAVLIHILNDRKVSINDICGAICIYLLFGFAWGLMYYILSVIEPNSIHVLAHEIGRQEELSTYAYFSFMTLTSVGYGDIYPISSWARLLAVSEAIIGQIYSVVLIGWLVSKLSKWHR